MAATNRTEERTADPVDMTERAVDAQPMSLAFSNLPTDKFLLIDETTRYPSIRKQMEELGGRTQKIGNTTAWEFVTQEAFERADLIVNTFQDQTIIRDPNTVFVRGLLASRKQPWATVYGGTQRQLTDGSYAFEFPSIQAAANALALVYGARQLTAEQKASLSIINEFLKSEDLVSLYGFDPKHEPDRLAELDQYTARRIIARARLLLYDLEISPAWEQNYQRACIIVESLSADRFEEVFGFNPVLQPHLLEKVLGYDPVLQPDVLEKVFTNDSTLLINFLMNVPHDPVETARIVLLGAPIMREMRINMYEEIRLRRELYYGKKPTVDVSDRVAETVLPRDELRRNIGAYVDEDKEQRAARADEFNAGEEHLHVLQTARDVLDLEGKVPELLEFEPGDWIQGYIIAHNRGTQEIDNALVENVAAQFIAVHVISKTSDRTNSWNKAPEGTMISAAADRLVLSRLDKTVTSYQIEDIRGSIKIAQREGNKIVHGQTYPSIEAAQAQIQSLTRLARASIGYRNMHQGQVGVVIVPAERFADRRFREELAIRASMSNNKTPISLGYQPDGQITYMQAHVRIGRSAIFQDPNFEYVVPRPTTLEMQKDYQDVVALARSQIAARLQSLRKTERDPNTIRERPLINDDGKGIGYECEVLNYGRFYLATRIRDAVAIHELAAFPGDRQFEPGEKFGVLYEDGIPREFEVDQAWQRKTFDQTPLYMLENLPAFDKELVAVLGMDESSALTSETERLLEAQVRPWKGVLISFMEQALAQFELHEERKFSKVGNAFKGYNQEQDVIEGTVLAVDATLQLAAVTYGNRFTTINLRYLNGLQLDVGDQVKIAVANNQLITEQYVTRQERIDGFTAKARVDLAKEEKARLKLARNAKVRVEGIIVRSTNMENDQFHGIVRNINPQLQYAAIAAGGTSLAVFDLTRLEQPIALDDEVTIVTREGRHHVTSRVPLKDRTLVPEQKIIEEIDPKPHTQSVALGR